LRLRSSIVRFAEQDRTREVRVFNAILVHHEHVADAEQREVLDDLVSEGAGADDDDTGRRKSFLIPPLDEPKAMEAVVLREVF
jgi:hypothetical protein